MLHHCSTSTNTIQTRNFFYPHITTIFSFEECSYYVEMSVLNVLTNKQYEYDRDYSYIQENDDAPQ